MEGEMWTESKELWVTSGNDQENAGGSDANSNIEGWKQTYILQRASRVDPVVEDGCHRMLFSSPPLRE
jgi:hypothetical protein